MQADAPSRGQDLKPAAGANGGDGKDDAPSRGHDLKHVIHGDSLSALVMPPHGGMT